VARYDFRCAGACGTFEQSRPMDAPAAALCPRCGGAARRVFAAPLLTQRDTPLRKALAREARTSHEPEIVRRPLGPRPSTQP